MHCRNKNMILFAFKILLVTGILKEFSVDASPTVLQVNAETPFGRVAAEFFNMNVVCAQCDDLCPKPPSVSSNPEEGRKAAALHWACYIGCRTTCLLQMGPDKFDYDSSKNLCIKGCHDEYKTTPGNENQFSRACIDACSDKVVTPKLTPVDLPRAYAHIEIEETETILFDASLDMKSGGLPRSTYKTLPRKDSMSMYTNIKKRLSAKSSLNHLLDFITDPVWIAVITIPLMFTIFGLMWYVFYLGYFLTDKHSPRSLRVRRNIVETMEHPQLIFSNTFSFGPCSMEEKKEPLLSEEITDDEFVPPSSPPPKYSDIVQTV